MIVEQHLIELLVSGLQLNKQFVVLVGVCLHALVSLLELVILVAKLARRVDDLDSDRLLFQRVGWKNLLRVKVGVVVELAVKHVALRIGQEVGLTVRLWLAAAHLKGKALFILVVRLLALLVLFSAL